jgi:hypothetical protein
VLLKIIIILLSCFWGGLVFSGEKISQSMDITQAGVVNIYNERGAINIEGWAQNKIKVEGELDSQAKTFIFRNQDNVTNIRIELLNAIRRGEGSKLRVFVPFDSQLLINGMQSDINVSNITNTISIESTIGAMSISEVQNKVSLKTISGPVTVTKALGEINVTSVNGNIAVESSASLLKLKTVSGNVKVVNSQPIENFVVSSISGSIRYLGAFKNTSTIVISNIVGNIEIISTNKVFPSCKVSNGPKGKIINEINQGIPMEALDKSLLLNLKMEGDSKNPKSVNQLTKHNTCIIENDSGLTTLSAS